MREKGTQTLSPSPAPHPLLKIELFHFFLDHPDHFRHNPKTSVAALRLLIGIAKLLIAFTQNR
jgi:hypothetical protein